MYENNYYKTREIHCNERIRDLLEDLPYFMRDFVIGIESYTSPLTRLNYVYDSRIFFDFLTKIKFKNKIMQEITLDDLNTLDVTDLEYYISYLNSYTFCDRHLSCDEKGKARKCASVRALFKFFYNKDKLTQNVASKLHLPKKHDDEIIRLDVNEVVNLLNLAEDGASLTKHQKAYHENTKIRDVAILTLFLGTGIRNSELVGLNVDDINFDNYSFIVTRKGGNRAILFFNEEVANALIQWIEYRKTIEGLSDKEKALFVSLQNRRISVRTIQELVKKYAKIISPQKKITPHKLRSTFGTNLYAETRDIYVVADLLGHRDINTTKKHYAAIGDEVKRQAIKSYKLREDK